MRSPGLSSISTCSVSCSSFCVIGTSGVMSARSSASLRIRVSSSCAVCRPDIASSAERLSSVSFMGIAFKGGLIVEGEFSFVGGCPPKHPAALAHQAHGAINTQAKEAAHA